MVRFIMFAICSSCVLVTSMDQSHNSSQAQLIWDSVIAAKGGRGRLHAIRTIAYSSQAASTGVRYWLWADYRPGRLGVGVKVWNGLERALWIADDLKQPERVPWTEMIKRDGEARLRDFQAVYLLESAFFRPSSLRVTRQDRTRVVLEATAPGFADIEYVVDRKTWLPLQIVLRPMVTTLDGGPPQAANFTRAYVIGKCASVGDVAMPERIDGIGIHSYMINPDVDPRLFETAPVDVTTAGAWRRYLRK
jgi:hypothetical protein